VIYLKVSESEELGAVGARLVIGKIKRELVGVIRVAA
jgi:hypothetical protein